VFYISSKLDDLGIMLHIQESEIDKKCKLEFAYGILGTHVTIIGFVLATIMIFTTPWFSSILRIVAFAVMVISLFSIITLWLWVRSLIASNKDLMVICSDINEQAQLLQNNHRALSREHEKIVDKYDMLEDHYSVLIVFSRLLSPDMSSAIEAISSNKSLGGRKNAV